ncbi:NADH-quinone oxidoreductase subunit C [Streptomyces capillispiralis]|uniref:NADH-quinone oxidoreductase subunit C n=1 Tax=Streptomyces capillispiralis TaxID=68182 RepID=UPI00167B59D8|nr:NADH-quinone oxidoreductase subunit C [Streptomyces capillispiralis]GHH89682.1 dehydrogenase [Streptomyces capillispiralis]
MTAVGWLPADAEELFGPQATAEESYGVLTVDVPPASWISALETARDRVGCTYFDWLSAVDEPGTGFRVTAHVAALSPVRRLLLRTTVAHDAPTLPSAVTVYAGAAWHERETHEMFGVDFTGHPGLDHLLLPDGFEGHPLRKDFVLAARVAKAWPGAKEPGESEHGGPKRRQMLPPGVPDPNEWGPLKGQLPPAPARPARGAGRAAAGAGAGRAAGAGERLARAAAERTGADRPPRRARSAAEGSASQAPEAEGPAQPAAPPRRSRTAADGSASQVPSAEGPAAQSPAPPRRSRTAAEGSASQAAEARPEPGTAPEPTTAPARRARGASEGSASQRSAGPAAGGPRRARTASGGSASQRAASDTAAPSHDAAVSGEDTASAPTEGRPERRPPAAPRSPDAPWHHARPSFTGPEAEEGTEPDARAPRRAEDETAPATDAEPERAAEPTSQPETTDPQDGPKPPAPDDTRTPTPTPDEPTTPEDPSGGPR